MREAVAAADAEVDFSPYNLVYVMPPRNATGIEFSPELNFYQEPLRPDGKVIRNGVTYGQDMFSLGPQDHQPRDRPRHLVPGVLQRRHRATTHQWVGGWDLMGDILGHAPDYMSWNKWKVGWLDDHDFGCLASDGTAEYTLSARPTPSDGGLTKKGVVVRTGPHDRDRSPSCASRSAPTPPRPITPGPHRHVRLGRAALQARRAPSSTPTARSRCIDEMPGSTRRGLHA